MKQILKEYNVTQEVITLYGDNMSAINISKNPVRHSRTKDIDIRPIFTTEFVEEKIISLDHASTDKQLEDIFTKALDVILFEKLKAALGLCVMKL